MKQSCTYIRHWLKQAAAAGCFLLLSFVLYVQAFHHHDCTGSVDAAVHIEKLTTGKEHCSICDHITTRIISGDTGQLTYSLVPPQPQVYNPYSYYITIARDLFIQAYTNKGPPSFNLSVI